MNVEEILIALQNRTISPDEAEALLQAAHPPAEGPLHPLLHRDTSDASGQRFTSTFSGEEFFLADHVVKGARVMPGVAYLEMARAAVAQLIGVPNNGVRLKNVAWSRPFVVGDAPAALHIAIAPQEGGSIAYEIYSVSAGPDDVVVHSQGVAIVEEASLIPPVRVGELRALCQGESLKPAQCYGAFRAIGLEYGPAHRGLESVAVGVDAEGRRFVLADVLLPQGLSATRNQYALHPSVMDAALQAPIGLMMGKAAMKPALPFALGELQIAAPCPSRAVVVVREAAGSSDRLRKLDIDICDAAGNVCVRFAGFSARVLEGQVREAATGVILLAPRFEAEPARDIPGGAYASHWVVLCEIGDEAPDLPGAHCVALHHEGEDIARRFERHAATLLELIQRILRDKPKGDVFLQLIVPAEGEGWLFSGLSGLMKTAQQENPKLIPQTIGIDPGATAEGLLRVIRQGRAQAADALVRYRMGTRYVARFKEIAVKAGEGAAHA